MHLALITAVGRALNRVATPFCSMCSGTYRYRSHQIHRERPRITDARMGSHLLLSDPPAGEIMNTVAETVLCHLVICVDEILHLHRGGGQRMRRDIKPLLSLSSERAVSHCSSSSEGIISHRSPSLEGILSQCSLSLEGAVIHCSSSSEGIISHCSSSSERHCSLSLEGTLSQ